MRAAGAPAAADRSEEGFVRTATRSSSITTSASWAGVHLALQLAGGPNGAPVTTFIISAPHPSARLSASLGRGAGH
jgi:hypothetical protein